MTRGPHQTPPIRVHRRGLKDNRAYYDEFSHWYERERHHGYHRFLDEMALHLLAPYLDDRRVLEVGCGTGLILQRVTERTAHAVGIDLSAGMLGPAKARGLRVVQAGAGSLPFRDASFDTVYSFKVLAHVQDIDQALSEMIRVTRPGGHLVLEFYNRDSLRWLIKRFKPAHAVSEKTTDHEVFTRYDSLSELERRVGDVPGGRALLRDIQGIRVVTPWAGVLRWPLFGGLIHSLERRLATSPLARYAGFLVLVLERQSTSQSTLFSE